MRVAIVAEWYPSPADPVLGIWAHRQAMAARGAGADVRVLADAPPGAAARQRERRSPDTSDRCAAGPPASARTLEPLELDGIAIGRARRRASAPALLRQPGATG